MRLEDLPDDFRPEQFRLLDKESLDRVPFTKLKWVCRCKGCEGGTTIRDYGIGPWYWLHRNSKRAQAKPQEYWFNTKFWFWLCGKHQAIFRRLGKRFDMKHIQERFLDSNKICILEEPKKRGKNPVSPQS